MKDMSVKDFLVRIGGSNTSSDDDELVMNMVMKLCGVPAVATCGMVYMKEHNVAPITIHKMAELLLVPVVDDKAGSQRFRTGLR